MSFLPNTLRLLALGGVLALPVLAPTERALAQNAAPDAAPAATDDEDDQEIARKALEMKEILPLGTVLAQVESQFTGDVVEIELERKKGLWVYEIEIIGEDGRVRDVDVDGKTGKVITVEFDE